MSKAVAEYEKLIASWGATEGVVASQMFGKPCLKANGKAFLAQHKDFVVFKLSGHEHRSALSIKGAELWDPSGKGRPMKEWVAVPAEDPKDFGAFAAAALGHVSGG